MTTFALRIPVVAGSAGGLVQGLLVTVAARGTAVVNSASTFIGDGRMRAVVSGGPVVHTMTRGTIQTEHARMEGGVAMAARTRCR